MVQPLYRPLALGTIKARGWLRDQLQLEADGLAGHMFDFYRFVNDSQWLGGATEYSVLDEASPYWFNGLVPLAFSLGGEHDDDSGSAAAVRIRAQVRQYLDYVLDHQQADGWLGFETTRQTRGLWARCLLLLGLMVRTIGQGCMPTYLHIYIFAYLHIYRNEGLTLSHDSNTQTPTRRRRTASSTPCTATWRWPTTCCRTTTRA